MRNAIVLASLFACPLSALAEDPAPAGAAPDGSASPRLDWSIGAGVGFSGPSISSNGFPDAYLGVLNRSAPIATASLERRLAPRTWLMAGVTGTFDHSSYDVAPGMTGITSLDAGQLGVSAGVRQVLTSPAAPIDVSVIGLLEGGVGSSSATWVNAIAGAPASWTDWYLGASGGVTVDRELSAGLYVRVGTPVLSVRWSSLQAKQVDQAETTGSSLGVALRIAPYLELRLAF